MLSQEAITHAGACSICWMCRHLCPIGYVTGREIHFPRGKATLVSLSARGNDVMDESAQAMYDCLLCNSCANWCETGYQPVKFIREARRELVVRGALPESIAKVVDGTLNNGGCIYGEKHFTGALKEAVDRLPDKARVLLVMGDTIAMRRPEIGLAAMSLMRKAAINFTVLKEEPSPANDLYDLIGELEDVQIYAQAFQKAVHQTGCETVVVLDPYAARILIEDYPRWGCAIQNIRTGTAFFAGLLEKGTLRVAGADTYITAKALAQAIKVIGDIDLILCGRHTVDGETGQTGPELAAMLGYVCVGQVVALTGMEEGELICQCMGQEGIQVISVRLPAVLCVCECQRPVYLPSIAAMRRAASLPVKTLSTAALGMDGICAQHDSPTQVVRLRHKEHVRRNIHFLTQKDSMIQTILSLIAGSEEVNRD